MKSLAGDIRENLRRPLTGIAREEREAGLSEGPFTADLLVAVRTGDTPQADRRRMIKKPPHILITTPESLYLMLTAQTGQSILRTARWIILDELHALIDTKRGAHLMLTLARLDRLCGRPLQRIGLSATIRPLERAAAYLSPSGTEVVAPRMDKAVEIAVTSPHIAFGPRQDSIWQAISAAVFEHCAGTRTALAFVDGRAYAERLAYHVNQLGGEGFARTHHGSLSREQRHEVEHDLRSGTLRLLCATSSMELGIDVGEIDRVFQIGCPRSISGTLQRLGRAGHNPGRTSVMHIFPRVPAEALYAGLTAEVVRDGGVEDCHPPRLCLDVLAQHLVSMAAGGGYTVDDVLSILPRAYPFREVTAEDVRDVLRMLAGDWEHGRDIPVRPRLLYDRIHDRVEGDPYSRMLAVSAGGTIPDRGLYTVRTETGVKIGELDEEFVFEARVGDRFLLGSFSWQILSIQQDRVVVSQSAPGGARPPFWKGEIKGRPVRTGAAFGALLHQLDEAHESGRLREELIRMGLDENAAAGAEDLVGRQVVATGGLPDDRTLLVERFMDETGLPQLMIHSVFGRMVNEPLAILAAETIRRETNIHVGHVEDDDGFLLYSYDNHPLPAGLLSRIPPESARPVLSAILTGTPLFNMAFRYNAGRALMMGVRKAARQPLWVQRLRGAEMLDALAGQDDHPLIRETRRECLEDYWDLEGVQTLLDGIRSGAIRVREMEVDLPSPLSYTLRQRTEAALMYDYAPTTPGIQHASAQALEKVQGIAPDADRLEQASRRARLPGTEQELHTLLMIEGDLIAGEIDVPVEWLDRLARAGRAAYVEPGLWIAAEHGPEYEAALDGEDGTARGHIVRRALRYRGGMTPEQVADRYLWPVETAQTLLQILIAQEEAVESDGVFYHAELYERARRETLQSRRRQIRTLPAQRYAALLADRVLLTAPPAEKLETALRSLAGTAYPASLWESVLLPLRVSNYRPELLDQLLAQGNFYWRLAPDGSLAFHQYEEIDWDTGPEEAASGLPEHERQVYEMLARRGASFMHRLTGLPGDGDPDDSLQDILMRLAGQGRVCADSFVPIRQWLEREKRETAPARQRAKARAMARTAGRWEIARPLRERTPEAWLECAFDRAIVLSRETVQGLSWSGPGVTWSQALEILRVWEYTGRARRGYFVEGLSGIQFIRGTEYAGVLSFLQDPPVRIQWLSAADPAQPWGKSLPHLPERSFLNVPGTAVALRAGLPVAVMERQGRTLRVFDDDALPDALSVLVSDYGARRIFPWMSRLTVREYPPASVGAMERAGFIREIQDYVVYRGYR